MILNVGNLLTISLIILLVFAYKSSAKNIILYLDHKIMQIKHDFKDSNIIKVETQQKIEQINKECDNLSKEIAYIQNHLSKELEYISKNLDADIANYERELQQNTNFIITQKKDFLLKEYKKNTAQEIEKLVHKYVAKSNSIIENESLLNTISSKLL